MRADTSARAREPQVLPAAGEASPLRRRPRPWRLSSTSVLPIALALLGGALAYIALHDRSAVTSVLVVSTPVPAGSPVDAQDTELVDVHSSEAPLRRGLLELSQLSQGLVAAVPLRAGEVLTESELERPSPTTLGQMSIPVPLQQADGGNIGVGDQVDVISSTGTAPSTYVAQSLRVLAVAPVQSVSGVLGGASGSYYIVVAVDKATALRVAAALAGGTQAGQEVQVVRSTGEAPLLSTSSPVTSSPVTSSPVTSSPAASSPATSSPVPASANGVPSPPLTEVPTRGRRR